MKMKGLLKIACIVPAVVMAVASGAQSPSAVHKGIVPAGDAFLEQLQKRDSVLIADQLRYGFRLENVKAGTALGLPDLSHGVMDSIEVVSDWKLDTLKFRKKKMRWIWREVSSSPHLMKETTGFRISLSAE